MKCCWPLPDDRITTTQSSDSLYPYLIGNPQEVSPCLDYLPAGNWPKQLSRGTPGCSVQGKFPKIRLQRSVTGMKISKTMLGLVLGVALVGGGLAVAQKPADNVSGKKHPNLAAAQRLSTEAYEKITAAQQANEWDMDGHAAKAKELLDQVNKELKMAAEAANKNKK
jgi:hypothetical protein